VVLDAIVGGGYKVWQGSSLPGSSKPGASGTTCRATGSIASSSAGPRHNNHTKLRFLVPVPTNWRNLVSKFHPEQNGRRRDALHIAGMHCTLA
jgi:hypothetical protein